LWEHAAVRHRFSSSHEDHEGSEEHEGALRALQIPQQHCEIGWRASARPS
jgi:hypothetical protein